MIRQRAGFLYLGRGDLSLAREQLLLGGTDPREVISLYPGIKVYPAVLRIRDVYPGYRIQKQQQKRGVEKKSLLSNLFLYSQISQN